MEETQKMKKPLSPVIIIVVILLIGFIGSKMKSTTNEAVKVKTKEGEVMVSEEKGLAWPSDLPIDIPKYDNGKIKAYSHLANQTVWTIIISNTNEEYFKKYKDALIADKWIAGDEMVSIVSMVSMKKDGYDVNVVWDASSNGALITLSQTIK